MKILFTFFMCIMYTLVVQGQNSKPSAKTPLEVKFNFTIININPNNYGYDVFSDNKLLIHQPSMPGMPGNKGFTKKADAEKIAKLVIEKLKEGLMPPAITIQELKKLKVIN